jgi:hypothetical protein
MTTPAGWYEDPENSNTQRYWDGQNWTPHRGRKNTTPTTHQSAPAAAPPPPPPAPGTTPWDQRGAYVGMVQPHVAKGGQFWSGLSRRRKIISAIVVCAAGLLILTFLYVGSSHVPAGVGHSSSYKEGYDIASHEVVQESLMGHPDDAEGACQSAYDTYNGSQSSADKGQYIAGCLDWVNTHPRPVPPTFTHGGQGY